jgi:hypothetical protein
MKLALFVALLASVAKTGYVCTKIIGSNGGLTPTYGFTESGVVCNDGYVIHSATGTKGWNNPYEVNAFRFYGETITPPIERLFVRCAGLKDKMDKNSIEITETRLVQSNNDVSSIEIPFREPIAAQGSPGGYAGVNLIADTFVRYMNFHNTQGELIPQKMIPKSSFFNLKPSNSTMGTECVIVGVYAQDSKYAAAAQGNNTAAPPIGGIGFIFQCRDDVVLSDKFKPFNFDDQNGCNAMVDRFRNNKMKYRAKGASNDEIVAHALQ